MRRPTLRTGNGSSSLPPYGGGSAATAAAAAEKAGAKEGPGAGKPPDNLRIILLINALFPVAPGAGEGGALAAAAAAVIFAAFRRLYFRSICVVGWCEEEHPKQNEVAIDKRQLHNIELFYRAFPRTPQRQTTLTIFCVR